MPANFELIRRSGDLKRQVRKFAEGRGCRGVLRQAFERHFGKEVVADEDEIGNFFDRFLM